MEKLTPAVYFGYLVFQLSLIACVSPLLLVDTAPKFERSSVCSAMNEHFIKNTFTDIEKFSEEVNKSSPK